jgi:outer membrane murein-binding lipoprotein Lpp
MKNKIKIAKSLLLITAFITTGGIAALAQTSSTSDLDQLKVQMQEMQKNMDQMQQKIDELEKEKSEAAQTQTNAEQTSQSVQTLERAAEGENIGEASPVADRANLNDQQEAAPRPGDQALDPKYLGYFPIPNTPVIMMFNAKPRVDMMEDNKNSGNNDRFVTATIPINGSPGSGGGERFNMTAKGSSLSWDVRAPDMPGDFRFYYNNDFFGSGSGMAYRLKQLYGQLYNVTAGFTYSVFEDPDVWPDTVDFEGPNSMIFARQPTVRYMVPLNDQWQLNFGIQQPSSDIDNTGTYATSTAVNHFPDGGFNIRWENADYGHVQLATIFRDVGANSPTVGEENVLGWGENLSTSLKVFDTDSVQAQLTYGQGIFHFCNDNFTYAGFNGGDAAYNDAGELRALTYFAPMLGYTHQWTDKFRSTATSGYVNLQNEQAQAPEAYHETYYESVNLVWQLRKRLSVGAECLFGYDKQNSGDHGEVWRFQMGMVYTLF